MSLCSGGGTLGPAYWEPVSGTFLVGNSPANTGHKDYGYWNTEAAQTCQTGSISSQVFTLPAGTYTISAVQVMSGVTTTGCGTPFANVAIYAGARNIANMSHSKNWNSPVTFTLTSPTSITWRFTYQNYNFPTGSYLIWYAPQLEAGSITTAYKQSVYGASPAKILLSKSSTLLSRYAKYTQTETPVAVAANTCAAQKLTVTGIQAADTIISAQEAAFQPGLSIAGAITTGTDTVSVNFCNNTASSITPTAGETYTFVVVQ